MSTHLLAGGSESTPWRAQGSRKQPVVVLYIPAEALTSSSNYAKLSESGMYLVGTGIDFKELKEVCLLVPDENHFWNFKYQEAIIDTPWTLKSATTSGKCRTYPEHQSAELRSACLRS